MSNTSNKQLISRLKHLREMLGNGYSPSPSPPSKTKKRTKSSPHNKKSTKTTKSVTKTKVHSSTSRSQNANRNIEPKYEKELLDFRIELGSRYKDFLEERNKGANANQKSSKQKSATKRSSSTNKNTISTKRTTRIYTDNLYDDTYAATNTLGTKSKISKRSSTSRTNNVEKENPNIQSNYTKSTRSQSTSHHRHHDNEYYVPPPIGKSTANKISSISNTTSKTTQNYMSSKYENENNQPNIKSKYTYTDQTIRSSKPSSSVKDKKTLINHKTIKSTHIKNDIDVSNGSESNNINILSNGRYLLKGKQYNPDLSQSSSSVEKFDIKSNLKNYKTPNPEITSKRSSVSTNKTSRTVVTKVNDDFSKKKLNRINTATKKIDFSDYNNLKKDYNVSSDSDSFDINKYKAQRTSSPIKSKKSKVTSVFDLKGSDDSSIDDNFDNILLRRKVVKMPTETISQNTAIESATTTKTATNTKISKLSSSDSSDNFYLNKKPGTTTKTTKTSYTSKVTTKSSPTKGKIIYPLSSSSSDDLSMNKILNKNKNSISNNSKATTTTTKTITTLKTSISSSSSTDDLLQAQKKKTTQFTSMKTNINLSSSSEDINLETKKKSPISSTKPSSTTKQTYNIDSSDDDDDFEYKQSISKVRQTISKVSSQSNHSPINKDLLKNIDSSDELDQKLNKQPISSSANKNLKLSPVSLDSSDSEPIVNNNKFKPATTNNNSSSSSDFFLDKKLKQQSPKNLNNLSDESSDMSDLLPKKVNTPATRSNLQLDKINISDDDSEINKKGPVKTPINISDSDDDFGTKIPNPAKMKPVPDYPSLSSSNEDDIMKNTKINTNSSPKKIPVAQNSSSSSSPVDMNPIYLKNKKLTNILDAIDDSDSTSNQVSSSKPPLSKFKPASNGFLDSDSDIQQQNKKGFNISSSSSSPLMPPSISATNQKSPSDLLTPPKITTGDIKQPSSAFKNQNSSSSDDVLGKIIQNSKQANDSSSPEFKLSDSNKKSSTTTTPAVNIDDESSDFDIKLGKQVPVFNAKNDSDSDSLESFKIPGKPPVSTPLSPAKPIPQSPPSAKDSSNRSDSSPHRYSNLDESDQKRLRMSPPVEIHSPDIHSTPDGKKQLTLVQAPDFGSDEENIRRINILSKKTKQSFVDNQLSSSDDQQSPSETEKLLNKYNSKSKYSEIMDSTINVNSNISPSKKSPKKDLNKFNIDSSSDLDTDLNLPKPSVSVEDNPSSSDSDTQHFIKKTSNFLENAVSKLPPLLDSDSTTEEIALNKLHITPTNNQNLFDSDSFLEINTNQKKSSTNTVKTEKNTLTNISASNISSSEDDSEFTFQPPSTKDTQLTSIKKEKAQASHIDIDDSTDTETLLSKFKQNKDDESYEKRMKDIGKEIKKEDGKWNSEEENEKFDISSSSSIKINSNLLANPQFSLSATDDLAVPIPDQQFSSSNEEQIFSIQLNKKGKTSTKKEQVEFLSDEDSTEDIISKINHVTNKSSKEIGILDESNSDDDDDKFNLKVPSKAPTVSSEAANILLDEGSSSVNPSKPKNETMKSPGNKKINSDLFANEIDDDDDSSTGLISQIQKITNPASNILDENSSDDDDEPPNLTIPTKTPTVSSEAAKILLDEGSSSAYTKKPATEDIDAFLNKLTSSNSNKGINSEIEEEEEVDDDDALIGKTAQLLKQNNNILDENSDDDINSAKRPTNSNELLKNELDESSSPTSKKDNVLNSSSKSNKSKSNTITSEEYNSEKLITKISQYTKQDNQQDSDESIENIGSNELITKLTQFTNQENIPDESSSDDIKLVKPTKPATVSSEAEKIVLDESSTSITKSKTNKLNGSFNLSSSNKSNHNVLSDDEDEDELMSQIKQFTIKQSTTIQSKSSKNQDNIDDESSSDILNQAAKLSQNILNKNEDEDDDDDDFLGSIEKLTKQAQKVKQSSNILSDDENINLNNPVKTSTISSEAEKIVLDESSSLNNKLKKKENKIDLNNSFNSSSSDVSDTLKKNQNISNKDDDEDDDIIGSFTKLTKQAQSQKQNNLLSDDESDDENINLSKPTRTSLMSSEAEKIVLDESLSSIIKSKDKNYQNLLNDSLNSSSPDAKENNKPSQNLLNKDEDEEEDDDIIESIDKLTKQAQKLKQSSSILNNEDDSDEDINLNNPIKTSTISSEAEKIVLDESSSSIAKSKVQNNNLKSSIKSNHNILLNDDEEEEESISQMTNSSQNHNILNESMSDDDADLTKQTKVPTASSEAAKILLDEGSSSAYAKQPNKEDFDALFNNITSSNLSKGKINATQKNEIDDEEEENVDEIINTAVKYSQQIIEEEEEEDEEVDSILGSFKQKQNSDKKESSQKEDDLDIDNFALYNHASSFSKKPSDNVLDDDSDSEDKDDLLLKIDSLTKGTTSSQNQSQSKGNLSDDDDDDILNHNLFNKTDQKTTKTTTTTTTTTTTITSTLNTNINSDAEEYNFTSKQKSSVTVQKPQNKANTKTADNDDDYDDTDSVVRDIMEDSKPREIFRFDDKNSSSDEEISTSLNQQKASQNSRVDSIFPKQQAGKKTEAADFDVNQNEEEEVFQFEADYTSDLMKKTNQLDNEYEEEDEEEIEKIIKSGSSSQKIQTQIIKPKKEDEEEENMTEKLIASVSKTQGKSSTKPPYDDFTSDDDLLDHKSGSVEDFNLEYSDNEHIQNHNTNESSNTEITNFTMNKSGKDDDDEEESKISALSQKFGAKFDFSGAEEEESDDSLDLLHKKTENESITTVNNQKQTVQTTVTTTSITSSSKQTKSFNLMDDGSDSDIDKLVDDGHNIDDIKTSSSDEDDQELIAIKQNYKNLKAMNEKANAEKQESKEIQDNVNSKQNIDFNIPEIDFEEEEEDLNLDEINDLINKKNDTINLAKDEEESGVDDDDFSDKLHSTSGLGFTSSNEIKNNNSLSNDKIDPLNKQFKIGNNSISIEEESDEDLLKSYTTIDGANEDESNIETKINKTQNTKVNQLIIIEEEEEYDEFFDDPELSALKQQVSQSQVKSEKKADDGVDVDFEIQADSGLDVEITLESDKDDAIEKIIKESDKIKTTPQPDDEKIMNSIKNIGLGEDEEELTDNVQQILLSNEGIDDLDQDDIDNFKFNSDENDDDENSF